jgi:hypothetical protein
MVQMGRWERLGLLGLQVLVKQEPLGRRVFRVNKVLLVLLVRVKQEQLGHRVFKV